MMRYLLLYFSVMTFNMCFRCVLILVFFISPPKLTTAQLRHLEIGIDATGFGIRCSGSWLWNYLPSDWLERLL